MEALLFSLGISACWFLAGYAVWKAMGPVPGEEKVSRNGSERG